MSWPANAGHPGDVFFEFRRTIEILPHSALSCRTDMGGPHSRAMTIGTVMTSTDSKPAAMPLPAATILLVRDAPDGIEVFMVKRHHQIDFVSGALVFPGGKVDKSDSEASLEAILRRRRGLDEAMRALGVCADPRGVRGVRHPARARRGDGRDDRRRSASRSWSPIAARSTSTRSAWPTCCARRTCAWRSTQLVDLRALDHAGAHAQALRHASSSSRRRRSAIWDVMTAASRWIRCGSRPSAPSPTARAGTSCSRPSST